MNRLLTRLFRAAPLLLAVYWLVLFIGTHWPKGFSIPTGNWTGLDKVLHFVGFFGLALLAAAACNWRVSLTGWHYRWLYVGLLAYAAFDEALQLIPALNRNADFSDFIANALGVTAGLAVYALLAWIARQRGLRLEREKAAGRQRAEGNVPTG